MEETSAQSDQWDENRVSVTHTMSCPDGEVLYVQSRSSRSELPVGGEFDLSASARSGSKR